MSSGTPPPGVIPFGQQATPPPGVVPFGQSTPAPSGVKPFSAIADTYAAVKHKNVQLSQAEAPWRANWDYLQAHPVEDLFDTLGAGQRAVGATVGGIEQHKGILGTLKQVGMDVFHPGDTINGMDATARDTESIRALVHAPTHQAIAQFVDANVPKELQPYAQAILAGGEDFMLQLASDPLTYLGGAGVLERAGGLARVTGLAMGGERATQALAALAHSEQALKLFPWLTDLAKYYGKTKDAAAVVFKARPELDEVTDSNGRAAVIQLENRHISQGFARRALDNAAVHDDVATAQRVRDYAARMHASPQSTNKIIKAMSDMTPEERAKAFTKMRTKLQRREISTDIADHLAQYGGYKPGVAPLDAEGWDTFLASHQTLEQTLASSKVGRALLHVSSVPRTLQQASLFLNPLPHGIKNVGELAYLAGGLRVIPRAAKAMVEGLDAERLARLSKIGADSGYTHELRDTVWSKIIPGWDKTAGGLQQAMGHMEQSWRSSLLDELDRKLGPSKNEADELMKGYIINDRLGDYRNQSAFVQGFKMLGGPWVAFRLGIVPKNVLRAIGEHPERVLSILRAQEDTQRNRTSTGQADNRLEFGGPTTDFARLASNPLKYVMSPASTGAPGEIGQAADESSYSTLGRTAADIVNAYNPFSGIMQEVSNLAGRGMPAPGPRGVNYQPQSMADRLVTTVLGALAAYYQKNPSEAALRYQQRETRRIGNEGEFPLP